uniref:Uncharacterized protein n=1 Tax=Cacopsylla melanoneura TaxID=428564 RepID=A0A8D8RTY4_9HEMI
MDNLQVLPCHQPMSNPQSRIARTLTPVSSATVPPPPTYSTATDATCTTTTPMFCQAKLFRTSLRQFAFLTTRLNDLHRSLIWNRLRAFASATIQFERFKRAFFGNCRIWWRWI